jgi:hypothetical protein
LAFGSECGKNGKVGGKSIGKEVSSWDAGNLCTKKIGLMLELWSLCFDEKNCAHKRSRSEFFITARIHRNFARYFFFVKTQEAIQKSNNFTVFSTSSFSEYLGDFALKGKRCSPRKVHLHSDR